jgi:SAM-dependent methyltransferase
MNEAIPQAEIDAAGAYEALMVPALFGPWSWRVADAAQIAPGHRVLDIACGTGVLAREAAARAGVTGTVTGLDPNRAMLEVARRLDPDIDWRHGLAESLPFAARSFDRVVGQFGLMFFEDRLEALRVLHPEGLLAVAVWDALENTPAYAAEVALLQRLAGQPAADALRAPFVLGHVQDLVQLFADAGVGSIDVATARATARFPSVRVMVEADLRGWLPVMGVVLPEPQIARILEEAEQVLAPYVSADGTVAFEASAHIVTGGTPAVQ